VILLLYIFWPSVPQFKYPFILLFPGYLLYAIITYNSIILIRLKVFVKTYYLILILAVFFFLGIIFTSKLYISLIKETIEILIILILLFLLMLIITSKSKLDIFCSNLLSTIIIFSFLIAVINTYVFIEIQKYYHYFSPNNYQNNHVPNFLLIDSNFALLPVFFGFIIVLYKLKYNVSKFKRIIYNLILLFFSSHIILSSSRRGQIILLLIIVILFFLRLRLFIKNHEIFNKLVSNLSIFYFSLILIPFFLFTFFHFGTYDFKVNTLKFLKVKDVSFSKRFISSSIYGNVLKYTTSLSYYNLNRFLWSTGFDPRDPDNGWGIGYYKTEYPLKGENVDIVPQGSKGYLLDNSSTYVSSNTNAYSNTFIGKNKVTDNDMVKALVYCYVSRDFNGDIVCLRADGTTYGNRVSLYNLNLKGTWQKLSISADCNNGEAPVALYFNKEAVNSFSSLKGYVIFAYPQCEIVLKDKDLSINYLHNRSPDESNTCEEKRTDKFGNSIGISNHAGRFIIKYLVMSYDKINLFDQGYRHDSPVLNNCNICSFNFLSHSFLFFDSIYFNKDPIKNWTNKLFKEDTSYYETKSSLKIDSVSKYFIGDRLSRWQFSLQIFTKEYNLTKKIFGGGFNFLNWYGYYFYGDKTKSDYPHNPFLYILLYSGILGLIIYLFFICRVFFYYLKYIKSYPLPFIFFLIVFFFTFFSGGSPFDPPMMGFFLILPFLIHSVHREDTQGLNLQSDN
jgi:hypothetical protein